MEGSWEAWEEPPGLSQTLRAHSSALNMSFSLSGASSAHEQGAQAGHGQDPDEKKGAEEKHTRAVEEGRCLFAVGIPPLWSVSQIEEFFSYHGDIESVYLLGAEPSNVLAPCVRACLVPFSRLHLQKGTNKRAAYVNFTAEEGAKNAALVCDRHCFECLLLA